MEDKFGDDTVMSNLNKDKFETEVDSCIKILPSSQRSGNIDTSKTEIYLDFTLTDTSAFVEDEKAEEEKFKIQTAVDGDINLNGDQAEAALDSHCKILSYLPKSENDETSSNYVDLERPQTPIIAFFKEEKTAEDIFEDETVIAEELCSNEDQVKTEVEIDNNLLICSPLSEKNTNAKEIYVDLPETPISAFLKEERAEDNDDNDERRQTVGQKTSRYSFRSLSVKSLNKHPMLLRRDCAKRNASYSPSYTNLHELFNENMGDISLSSGSKEDSSSSFSCSYSSSSDSLGYNSGSDDLFELEKKSNTYCLKCNKAFKNKYTFKYHSEAYHSKRSKCSHCNRNFRTEKMLKMHKENLVRCHDFIRTGKLFSNRVASALEIKSQSDENSSKVSLRLVPTHKLMKATDEENLAELDGKPVDATVDELDSSLISALPEGAGMDESNLILNSENRLVREVSTKVSCKICRSIFISKSDLKVHFATHTERKDCICGHCGKCFKNEKQLHTHTENLNTSHVFLQSGQVSCVSFVGKPSLYEEVRCAQQTVDEGDIKQIVTIEDKGVVFTPSYGTNIS